MSSPPLSNEQAETLCLEAIDTVDLYTAGMKPVEQTDTLPDALRIIEGLALYCQLLELSNSIIQGFPGDLDRVREAGRQSATAWRSRVTS